MRAILYQRLEAEARRHFAPGNRPDGQGGELAAESEFCRPDETMEVFLPAQRTDMHLGVALDYGTQVAVWRY